MKFMISLGIIIGGCFGGGIGNLFDHVSFFNLTNFGGWSIIWSTIGSFVGLWGGYKAGKNWF